MSKDLTIAERQARFKTQGVQVNVLVKPEAKAALDALCMQSGESQRQVIERLLMSANA